MPHVRICAGGGRKRSSLPRQWGALGQLLIILGNSEHHLPGVAIGHLFRAGARFLGTLPPMFRIVEGIVRHGRSPLCRSVSSLARLRAGLVRANLLRGWRSILNLTAGNINHELGKLGGIAGTFSEGHDRSSPFTARMRSRAIHPASEAASGVE